MDRNLNGFSNLLDEASESTPPWATRQATGSYFEPGALLPTRDGRVTSNAVVVSADYTSPEDVSTQTPSRIHVITDSGYRIVLTADDVRERYHEPSWIIDIYDSPGETLLRMRALEEASQPPVQAPSKPTRRPGGPGM